MIDISRIPATEAAICVVRFRMPIFRMRLTNVLPESADRVPKVIRLRIIKSFMTIGALRMSSFRRVFPLTCWSIATNRADFTTTSGRRTRVPFTGPCAWTVAIKQDN